MTAFEDLRQFIARVEEVSKDEVERINGVNPDKELGAIYAINGQGPNPKLFLFDEIRGYPKGYRVATNVMGSKIRGRLVNGIPLDLEGPLLEEFQRKRLEEQKPIPAALVSDSPILQNVMEGSDVDVTKFPSPVWHELDAGPYIGTASACLQLDPYEGWVNIGNYRSQVFDRNLIGLHHAHGHHGQVIRDHYFEQGQDAPVVIVLGGEPSLLACSGYNANWGISELEIAGWIRGEPVKVIKGKYGIPIPAGSEIVLEGRIMHPDHEPMRVEGQFGEGEGHYGYATPAPVVRVDTVYWRNEPIIMGQPPVRFLGAGFAGVNHLAMKAAKDAGFHDIRGIAGVGPFTVISVHQMYAGHAKRVADWFMSGIHNRPPRYLVLVDEDVDPTNAREVFWAISSRSNPQDSVHIYRNNWISPTSPRTTPDQNDAPLEHGLTMGCCLIDATMPFAWKDKFAPVNDVSPKFRKEMIEKWGEYLDLEPKQGNRESARVAGSGVTM
ncbi:MAG: hypothetical protein A3F84_04160 [Candidatus Handelsmanbacteria bacterium RIFCSPLOWO2_12_FULL_64_10]|uniref:UbiD family decarboxylase n=1 Tax=Handelsmanbacteria sp. (strain RIFCSPLOWO2_12_FULL_64_10) TaxID=1817868 RepID=A0A1F6CB69_HANXR|nr:MAG: hypothetical protein A3F84_04160 [Candidatus Handelsmanbacteria bacterium RIFCSPLOWO2_12_FULL_64_10]